MLASRLCFLFSPPRNPLPATRFFRGILCNLTWILGMVWVPLLEVSGGSVQAQELSLRVGPLYGDGKEPTGWGRRAYGYGWVGTLGYSRDRGGIPFMSEVQASQFTGRQTALDALQYQGRPMSVEQRFGLSLADVEFYTLGGKLLYTPEILPDSSTSTLRARLGMQGGQTTTAWLHPVTITRVYTQRPFVGPSIGFSLLRRLGHRWTFSCYADFSPFLLTSARRSTNEGQQYQEQPWRFSGPGNSMSLSSNLSIGYRCTRRLLADLALQSTQQTLGRGGAAQWNQTSLLIGLYYSFVKP